MSRRSYRGLMGLPAFGLFKERVLVASIRAKDAVAARDLFRAHGYTSKDGDRVRRLP